MLSLKTDAIPPEVRAKLAIRKKAQESRGMEFKLRPPRQIEPRGIEREFQTLYRRRFNNLFEIIKTELLAKLPSLLQSDEVFKPRSDGLGEDMFILIGNIKLSFAQQVTDSTLKRMILARGLKVNAHNERQFRKTFRQTLAVDPFQSNLFVQAQMENFVEQNAALIKTVDERFLSEVQEITFRGARQGLSSKEISRIIRERAKVAKSRADLIAADQVNKFNGQLNMLRQKEVGVTRYIWRTAKDERVRPEHQAREGKKFDWNEPPSDGHPGEPIRCRCYAEPIIEDLLGD